VFKPVDMASGTSASRLRLGLALICAGLLLAMMGLTVADVIGRYMLNAPVPGSTELTELVLAAVIFTGLPAASLDKDHIGVDLMTSRFKGSLAVSLSVCTAIVAAGVLGVTAWRLWRMGDQIGGYGGTTSTLKLPIAPLAYIVAVLTCIAAVLTLVTVFRSGTTKNG